MIYIRQEQSRRPKHHKLNVFQLMAIYNVCFNEGLDIKQNIIDELLREEILIMTRNGKLSMSREYQRIYTEIHSVKAIDWLSALKSCASKYGNEITRKTYMEFLPNDVSLDRVRYILSKLESMDVLKRYGSGKATKYTVINIPDNINF